MEEIKELTVADYQDALVETPDPLRTTCIDLLNGLVVELCKKQNILWEIEQETDELTEMNSGMWNGMEEAKDLINQYLIYGKSI